MEAERVEAALAVLQATHSADITRRSLAMLMPPATFVQKLRRYKTTLKVQ
jgi:hypothetical protein